MSYTHLIKETLDILDLSVTFNENCLTKEKIQRANLSYLSWKLDLYSPRMHPL